MQKLEPRTAKEKSIRITGGLALTVVSTLIGGFLGLIGIIVGLSLAGNAAFAKTKRN